MLQDFGVLADPENDEKTHSLALDDPNKGAKTALAVLCIIAGLVHVVDLALGAWNLVMQSWKAKKHSAQNNAMGIGIG